MQSSHLKPTLILTGLLTVASARLRAVVDHLQLSVDWVGLSLLSNLLIVAVLYYFCQHSFRYGWRLILLVFAMAFGIGCLNNLVEAFIFGVTDALTTAVLLGKGFLLNSLLAPAVVYMAGRWQRPNPTRPTRYPAFAPRSVGSWLWRIVVSDVLYLLFYIGAGMLLQQIYPVIMTFYTGKLPSIGLMIETQVFGRGLFFTGMAVLITRTMNQSVWSRALFIGAAFSILGGIAPLLAPNDAMPVFVRLGHGIEVGLSNLLYGLLIGRLLGQDTHQRANTRIASNQVYEPVA